MLCNHCGKDVVFENDDGEDLCPECGWSQSIGTVGNKENENIHTVTEKNTKKKIRLNVVLSEAKKIRKTASLAVEKLTALFCHENEISDVSVIHFEIVIFVMFRVDYYLFQYGLSNIHPLRVAIHKSLSESLLQRYNEYEKGIAIRMGMYARQARAVDPHNNALFNDETFTAFINAEENLFIGLVERAIEKKSLSASVVFTEQEPMPLGGFVTQVIFSEVIEHIIILIFLKIKETIRKIGC